jgi:hypothetical protein
MPVGATPSSNPVTLRPDLAEFMEFDIESERQGYVATQVLPVVETGLQSDNPGRVPLESLLFDGETLRNSGSNYNRGSFKFETFSYSTHENGWEEPIDERDEKRYQNLLQVERIANARAQGVVARNQEKRAAALVFNTTTWNGAALTTAITHEWDDATNCVPVTDVEAAVKKVYEGSGLWANALVINRQVFRNLRTSNQVRDRISSSGAGDPSKARDITIEMLKAVFDLDYIIVAGASKNTANENAAPTPAQIWSGEYAMVCRIATGADMREPCIGRTFHWSADGSVIGGTVEEYEEVQSRSRIIRVRHETDEVIMYPQAGHLISNITT